MLGKVIPLAPTASHLPWAVENLRFCPWCDQLAQKDLNDCSHVRASYGTLRVLTRPYPLTMPVSLRAVVLASLAACSLALGACGGDDSYGDTVPRSTPELTPPRVPTPAGDQANADGSSTTSTDETTTDETPSASGGTGGTGTATTPAPAPTQPAAPSSGAGTGGAATPTTSAQPEQTRERDRRHLPGEFNQFCQTTPGVPRELDRGARFAPGTD